MQNSGGEYTPDEYIEHLFKEPEALMHLKGSSYKLTNLN